MKAIITVGTHTELHQSSPSPHPAAGLSWNIQYQTAVLPIGVFLVEKRTLR